MNKVLIVEDEKLIRQGIKAMILRSGVSVNEIIECNNGIAALELLKSQQIDVMFTDIRMPKMDGITLVKTIQEMELTSAPLIAAISGFDDFDYAVQMLRNGAREYLLKPVDRNKITEVLNKFEAEIEQKNMVYETNKKRIYQRVQYMLLFEEISSEEIKAIAIEIEEAFHFKEYIVICTNYEQNDLDVEDKAYFISGKEYMNLFIVDNEYKYEMFSKLENYCIGTSRTYNHFRDLRQAYYEAVAMRKIAFGTCQHIVANDFFRRAKGHDYFGTKVMMQTANFVCSGKIEEALDILDSFVQLVKQRIHTLQEFEEQIHIILTTVINMYKHILKTNDSEIKSMPSMYKYQTIENYMDAFREWILKFGDIINIDEEQTRNKIKIQNAIEYIKQNYASDLNMAVVSNHVSMNYSLFSHTFKHYTGTNFVNYLKDIRVGEAKKLLQNTEMKINEISASVGYEHEKQFAKTFKSITGLTPSQYRNNIT